MSRVQLGVFLKKMGMPVEEQLEFWFQKSVDNAGQTFEEFSRRAGYQVRHIYGLEGGHKDYDVPACRTIQTGYFCPFSHLSSNALREGLLLRFPNAPENAMARVLQEASVGRPSLACSILLAAATDSPSRPMRHPMQWVKKMTFKAVGTPTSADSSGLDEQAG
jgi:DNA primase large subunit